MSARASLLLAALAAFASSPALAAEPPADVRDRAQVERYIRECENEWAAFSINRDPAPISAFLAADFAGVAGGDTRFDRGQALRPDTGPVELASDTIDYLHIRFPSPDVAIAQGGETAVWKNGERASRVWTDVWMLRNGRWRLVASHDTPLAKPRQVSTR